MGKQNEWGQIIYYCYKIGQSTIYYPGSLGQWDKRIIDQVSEVECNLDIVTSYLVTNPNLVTIL